MYTDQYLKLNLFQYHQIHFIGLLHIFFFEKLMKSVLFLKIIERYILILLHDIYNFKFNFLDIKYGLLKMYMATGKERLKSGEIDDLIP